MKKYHCLSCGKETNHIKREISATSYDGRGVAHTEIIEVWCCKVCGRPAGA